MLGHFPAINWLTSYSLYVDSLKPWYEATFGEEYMANRDKAMSILQQESELQEIVRLVGQDALSPADRLTMETAKMIREDFLQQTPSSISTATPSTAASSCCSAHPAL